MSNIMAKKIKIVKNSITNNEIIKKNKKYDFFRVSTPIFIVLLLISICINIVMYNKYNKTNNKLVETKENYHITIEKLLSVTNGRLVEDIRAKLDFVDRHVVIVIKEYGNYYYNYECYKKLTADQIIRIWNDELQQCVKVGNRDYTIWIYNIETAKSRGYKEGTC